MIYLDNSATSLHKPKCVRNAMLSAMERCGNPGRGGHSAAMEAMETVYKSRVLAGELFDCKPEQVVFTSNCTHGLNIAIASLVPPGARVIISGFEHNAVTRPLYIRGARVAIAGRRLFDWNDTLEAFENELRKGAEAAVFTHMSNVFGYILPVKELSSLCRQYSVPFIIDAAQSAGVLPVKLQKLGAAFIAMPGHKGLLGPQGTGMLLCGRQIKPLICGGTGSASVQQEMPEELPDRGEAGTVNVPGIAGLGAGMRYVKTIGINRIFQREKICAEFCINRLKDIGITVFSGPNQGGVVSFVPKMDCEEAAAYLSRRDIAVRAGLHCAPLAHESAGTLDTGTVRISFGHDTDLSTAASFLREAETFGKR